jgi:YggT family protein
MSAVVIIIRTLAQILSVLIVADALLSFALPPTHTVREALGKILSPLYAPIRRILPSAGGFDFSPLILLILIQVIETLMVNLLV